MHPITFTTYLEPSNKVGYTHITVPPEIVKKVGGYNTRLMCSINGNENIHCGLMSKGDGQGLIIINKKRQKAWDLNFRDEITATIELDTSKYGMQMCEELEALLDQDREGFNTFEKITAGQQRYIIHYVGNVKSSQKRIDRAIMLIENLKTMPPGKFDYRHLMGMEPDDK